MKESQQIGGRPQEPIVQRGEDIVRAIRTLCRKRLADRSCQTVLKISFDVFSAIAEYASSAPEDERSIVSIAEREPEGRALSQRFVLDYRWKQLREFFMADALLFNTRFDALKIEIDFFAPPQTIEIQ